MVKLNDYAPQLDQLLKEPNPFALVTAAHLLTQQTRGQQVKRQEAKWRLAKMLYDRNWDRQRIIDLFNVIDWMMRLPAGLQSQLMRDIGELERNRNMPYVSSFERKGRQEGQSEFLAHLLAKRFGSLPQSVRDRLNKASPSELETWGEALLVAPTLDSVFATR